MDIQWVIIARSYKLNPNKTLSIDNATDQFVIYGKINIVSLSLIAKVNFSPIETLMDKTITLKIKHDKDGELYSYINPYKVPDLSTLVNMTTYLVYPLALEFPYTGKYTFEMFIDNQYKNEESIDVIHKEIKDAKI
jgi:hypothetical protein